MLNDDKVKDPNPHLATRCDTEKGEIPIYPQNLTLFYAFFRAKKPRRTTLLFHPKNGGGWSLKILQRVQEDGTKNLLVNILILMMFTGRL